MSTAQEKIPGAMDVVDEEGDTMGLLSV